MAAKKANGTKGTDGKPAKKAKKIDVPANAPERIRRFFESGEVAAHEGRFAYGMEYFSSDSKLKLRFSPSSAANVLETYGEDLPDTAHVVPVAAASGESDIAFAVDPRKPELPVLYFEHEAGFHPFAPSFDAFLGNLLGKGEKTPLEKLAGIYEKARKLNEKDKHADVVKLLEPALAEMPKTKPRSLDGIADSLPESHNLLGLAYKGLGRVDDAIGQFHRAAELGSDMAALNLCDLQLEHFKDYEGLVASAAKLAQSSWRIGDAYEWYHSRNYLGLGQVLTNRAKDAERTYHQLWMAFRTENPERIAKSVKELREHAKGSPIAESILRWFDVQPRPMPADEAARLRKWWSALSKPLQEKIAEQAKVKGEPSDADLGRIASLDDLDADKLGLKDLSFLAPMRRLVSIDVGENAFTDFSTLPELPALRRLRAGEGKLASLRGIEKVPRLTKLFVRENPLTSIEGVEVLRDLAELDFAKAKVPSLEPVRDLADLEEITAYENKIEDLSPLGGCRRLKELSIFGNPVKRGLAALTTLPYLEEIDAISWKIPAAEHRAFVKARPDVDLDIELDDDDLRPEKPETTDEDRAWWAGLDAAWKKALARELDDDDPVDEQLGKLRAETDSLFLDEKDLRTLAPVAHLARADFANVAKNGLVDLSPLGSLPRLRVLRAGHNRAKEVKALGALAHLVELDLEANEIGSLDGLERCTSLRELDVSGNPLTSIDAARSMLELRELAMGETGVSSLAPLAGLARLWRVDVHGCPVKDLSPLAECPDLEELDCWSVAGLSGVEALAALPRLRRVTSHGALGEAAIAAFRAKRPDVEID